MTRGYLRLRDVARANLPIAEYPLPDVIARREAAGPSSDV